jgi:hypothetical protein
MTLAVEQITVMLATAGVGVPGQSLFAHRMPASVLRGLVVLPALVGGEIDYAGLPELRREAFQVIARDPAPGAARTLAARAMTALTLRPAWRLVPAFDLETPAVWVLYIRPRHGPIVFPRSDGGDIYEASVNFDCAVSGVAISG